MHKSRLIIVFLCALFGVTSIVVLSIISEQNIYVDNNFLRLFPPHPLVDNKKLDIKYNSYYIAGATPHHIYLGNSTSPYHVLIVDQNFEDTTAITFTDDIEENFVRGALNVDIDSPYVYMSEGITPKFLRGTLSSLKMQVIESNYTSFFSAAVPISPSSFVIRTYDSALQNSILVKTDIPNSPPVKSSNVLQRQVDGRFCTDGALHYDRKSARLTYTYFYRNEFIHMDTNFNITNRGHSIDTVSKAHIKVDKYSSKNSVTVTMSAPPLIVNRKTAVFDNRLFINSTLCASNEDQEVFNRYSVIDTYTLADGRYHFSFYLPEVNEKKIRDFIVINNKLFALQDTQIIKYTLNY